MRSSNSSSVLKPCVSKRHQHTPRPNIPASTAEPEMGIRDTNALSAQIDSEGRHFLFISEASLHCAIANRTKQKHSIPELFTTLPINTFPRMFYAPSVPIGRGGAHVAKCKIQHMIELLACRVQWPRPPIFQYALCCFSTWMVEAWQPPRAVSEQWKEHAP